MCVYSQVVDQGMDRLKEFQRWTNINPAAFRTDTKLIKIVRDLEKAIEAAQIVDQYIDQPDCELEMKKKALQEIAEELCVDISFPP